MQPLSFATRFGFAFVAFFRALFDGAFAARALAVKDSMPALPKAPRVIEAPKVDAHEERVRGALLLLELLQREGRLVDFSEQDIAKFSDADVGAAARLVHDGCRKALRAHVPVTPIRSEDEGSRLEDVRVGAEIKLVGEVSDALEKIFGRHRADTHKVTGVYAASYDSASGEDSMQFWDALKADIRTFAVEQGRRPRVMIAKLGQDGHDRGAGASYHRVARCQPGA